MNAVNLSQVETWTPHPAATPVTEKTRSGRFVVKANGTRTCCGGWQFFFTGIRAGQGYRICVSVRHEDIGDPRDHLQAIAYWDRWDPSQPNANGVPWNYLLPKATSQRLMELECVCRAPKRARCLTVRCIFRWSTRGASRWSAPHIELAELPARKPVKVCVVNATPQTRERIRISRLSDGLGLPDEVGEAVDLWASLARAACRKRPQLIVMPELVIRGKDPQQEAVEVPGPATAPFERIARDHNVHLVVGMQERSAGAVYNSAVVFSPARGVHGVYRKVHLATGEDLSGVVPGDSFPVFETAIGRIGCLICMDTTLCESARLAALNGAEFICFPIMGDLRADRFSIGRPIFNESRWKAIMRTRAIDNQVCMIVARNDVLGSCIINRKGDILAWNEGDQEVIGATVQMEDGYYAWDGGDFREVTFMLRRPHLYGIYSDASCLGPLRASREAQHGGADT